MTLDRLQYKLQLSIYNLRYRLRRLKRVLLCDPEIRPGRRALRQAIFYALNPGLLELVRALECGGYDARPTELTQGCELKIESLESVMKCVTFEPSHVRLTKKVNAAELREARILGLR